MIVGHALVAFALVAGLASALGIRNDRALALGAVAGGFAIVPDVDMVYAVVELIRSDVSGVWSATAAFWDGSKVIHRAITHSLVLGVPAAAAFALATGDRPRQYASLALVSGLIAAGLAGGGLLGAGTMGLYAIAGLGIAAWAGRLGLDPRATLVTALVGLLSHPFGDLFTGQPPRLLYPLGIEVVTERIALHPDPTLALLCVFGIELATVWLAVAVAARLGEWPLRARVNRRAAAGAGYGAAALVLPAPTLDVSYHFVGSILAVGTVGAVRPRADLDREGIAVGAMTGLVAVTLAAAAYAAVYAFA